MKTGFKILLLFSFLLIGSVAGAAVQHFEPDVSMADLVPASGVIVASAPLFISQSITQQLVDDLKLKYGKVKLITVVAEAEVKDADGNITVPSETYQFLVRRPDRTLIKLLLPLAESRKIDEFADKAIKNMVVGGDLNALDDGIVYMGVVSQLKELISPAQSFLSNA